MPTTIIDKHQLCEILGISDTTLRDQYKSWPHFYVCRGRDLRSARFVLEKIIRHLEKENANEGQVEGNMDRGGSKTWLSIQEKKRLQNKDGGNGMGKKDLPELKGGSEKDPFNLLAGIN